MFMIIILTVVVSVYILKWYVKIKTLDNRTSSLVTPPTLPLIGNALLFIGDGEKIFQSVVYLKELALIKGAVKIWLGPKLYVAIGNAEDAQVVLDNCLAKDDSYKTMRPWLGQGLFIAPVDLWKYHRKLIKPVFNNKIVDQYLDSIIEQSAILVRRLETKVDKGVFDVFPFITACTLDILFEATIGERMDVQHTPETPYLRARTTIMNIMNMRLFKVWLQPDCLFNLTPYAKRQKDNINVTRKFTDELITKRKKEYENNNISNTENFTLNGKAPSFLDLLFARKVFTDEQIRAHADSNTVAGNDTTALVTAYTLVLLGNHQDVQEKVYQEQAVIFGSDRSRNATREDLLQMTYLDRVINESMRFYSVAPVIARYVDKDIYLPYSDVTIPAGCGAVVSSYAIHRSKAEWGPDADEFDPDRFLPERSVNRHPAAFLPFSFGPRNCIGRNFGRLIVKGIISSISRNYKIKADPMGPLKMEMLMFPSNGHQLEISKR